MAVAAVKKIRDKSQAKKAARAQGFTFLDQLEEDQGCMNKPVTRVEYDMRGFLRQCLEKYESLVDHPVNSRRSTLLFTTIRLLDRLAMRQNAAGNSRPLQAESS